MIHPLELVSQADAQSRFRPIARRPVVVPTAAPEPIAALVPAHRGQKDDAGRADAQILWRVRSGDIPAPRDEIRVAAMERKAQIFAFDPGQADRPSQTMCQRNERCGGHFALGCGVREDAIAIVEKTDPGDEQSQHSSGTCRRATGHRPPEAAQTAADCLLVYHPFRTATGTDMRRYRLDSVVANDIARAGWPTGTAATTLSFPCL